MKKRIFVLCLVLMLIIVIAAVLSACNKQIVDLKLKFDYAYIKVGDEWKTVEVKKWNDYEGEQLQLVLKDGTTLLVSSMNCILYQGNLPK